MIIFDLSTLADDSHRRHFIDPLDDKNIDNAEMLSYNAYTGDLVKAIGWKPDYQSYYDAIDKDEPIEQVMNIFFLLLEQQKYDIQIWVNVNESYIEKVSEWFKDKLDRQFGIEPYFKWNFSFNFPANNNNDPYYKMKEEWMFEICKIDDSFRPPGIKFNPGIEMVFDNDPESIIMWRKNGIFCFYCDQGKL